MSDFNTFSDRDCERIGHVVRRVENKVNIPFEKRPAPIASSNSVRPVRIALTSSLASGTATGDVYAMDGTLIASGVTILDPEGVFFTLDAGNRGYGCQYMGKFYFNQNARCPT